VTIKFNSIPSKTLRNSITSAATSFQLNDILGWDGNDLTASDFGTEQYVVFRNAAKTQIEIMEIDPSTIASTNITITRRGLKFMGDLTTEVTANKYTWTKGDCVVDLGVATPQVFQYLKEYIDGIAISGSPDASTSTKGISKMSTAPVSPTNPIAVGDNDTRVPTQGENDALVGTSGTPSSSNKYVTNDDTATTPTSGKIVRLNGLSGVSRVLAVSASTTEIANNSASETDVFSVSIPANLLQTTNAIRFKIYVSDFTVVTISAGAITFRIKYGSTTLASVTSTVPGTSPTLKGVIDGILTSASTSSQLAAMNIDMAEDQLNPFADYGAATTTSFFHAIASGTAAENSTSTLDFKFTIQWAGANASNNFVPAGYIVELIS
jgi:hypothetical protein